PVQHGASIEVAAALDERDAARELTRPPPRDDRGVVALHPLAIRDRDVDRRSTERVAPLDHGAVEMRMRERDAADPALCPDRGDGLVIDVADAVPEDVAVRRPHKQGALPDPERRRHADSDESRLELAQLDPVLHQPKLFHRGPGLAALAHVLPLVLADGAMLRRRLARGLLHRAGRADVRPHSAAAAEPSSVCPSGRPRASRGAMTLASTVTAPASERASPMLTSSRPFSSRRT